MVSRSPGAVDPLKHVPTPAPEQGTLRSRSIRALLGPPPLRRLALTHALDDVADSLVNLSLVGSLFFSVSLEASRGRILLYLVLTAAPLAFVAPVVGPLLDRMRVGYRSVVLVSQIARVLLALGLATSLLSLAFYPLVFGVLLARKAYALGKTALVSQVVTGRDDLVAASGHLARTGTIAGGIGTAIGGALIVVVGVEWLPVVAAAFYTGAAIVTTNVTDIERVATPAAAVVRAETPSDVTRAAAGVSALKAAAGALTFLLAFAIKRGGGDEWIFAAALVAAGIGTFVGTVVSPTLHRHLSSDQVILMALVVPGAVSGFGVLTVGRLSIVAIALSIGLAGSVASRSMDAMYGHVPDLIRGRAIARTELRFQTANLIGAIVAVSAAPTPREGFAVVAVVLLFAGIITASRMRLSLRVEAAHWLLGSTGRSPSLDLPHALVSEALNLAERGEYRLATVLADSAVWVRRVREPDLQPPTSWLALAEAIDGVVTGRTEPDAALAMEVVRWAAVAVDADAGAADQASSGPSDGVANCSGGPVTDHPSPL